MQLLDELETLRETHGENSNALMHGEIRVLLSKLMKGQKLAELLED